MDVIHDVSLSGNVIYKTTENTWSVYYTKGELGAQFRILHKE
jgi:hypothetical protein